MNRLSVAKKTYSEMIFDSFNDILMVILLFLFIFPFWYELVLSFSSPLSATKLGLKLFPGEIVFSAYSEVLHSNEVMVGYFNTILRTVTGTALTLLITYCGAYSLSRKELPFRNILTILILFTMFFSGGLIPSYFLVRSLGLINSRWALILPVLTSAWNLILTRNFIMSLPKELEESAFIDGATPINIVFKIMLPLSTPILAVLAVWTAVFHWNAWFDAMIYVRDSNKMVLQLLLRKILIDQTSEIMTSGVLMKTTAHTTPETVKAATIMVSIGPIILVYPFVQKYFVKGIMIGSLKG